MNTKYSVHIVFYIQLRKSNLLKRITHELSLSKYTKYIDGEEEDGEYMKNLTSSFADDTTTNLF